MLMFTGGRADPLPSWRLAHAKPEPRAVPSADHRAPPSGTRLEEALVQEEPGVQATGEGCPGRGELPRADRGRHPARDSRVLPAHQRNRCLGVSEQVGVAAPVPPAWARPPSASSALDDPAAEAPLAARACAGSLVAARGSVLGRPLQLT